MYDVTVADLDGRIRAQTALGDVVPQPRVNLHKNGGICLKIGFTRGSVINDVITLGGEAGGG